MFFKLAAVVLAASSYVASLPIIDPLLFEGNGK
jgi:Na+-transporting methylmalonyl-CoA/oxaloacetate decarboxylase beta subunit